jgi:predicted choloylglycine hydrolase
MANDVQNFVRGAAPAEVLFAAISEARPGPAWLSRFRSAWPGWSDWLDRAGSRPQPERAARALRRYMPELAGTWERMVDLAGGDPRIAQFLTFWMPPRYLTQCSQMVIVDADGPALIRNYDLDPSLNEGCLYHSAWLGRDVMGMMDGIAGLADGMNAAGLCVSLAFGGRPVVGRGFGVPLIVRYLLEVCTCTADAIAALKAIPCHMSYNLTLIDSAGDYATVLVAPDRPPVISQTPFATNHQFGVSWPMHARLSRTVERHGHLERMLPATGDAAALRRLFQSPPIHSTRYGEGFGTVYTALYRPTQGSVEVSWPGLAPWVHRFDRFSEDARCIRYNDGAPPSEALQTA